MAEKGKYEIQLARHYASQALKEERKIRGWEKSKTGKMQFTKDIDELSDYERRRLTHSFSLAEDYFKKAGDHYFRDKFSEIVGKYAPSDPSEEDDFNLKERGLGKRLTAVVSILSLLVSLFFVASNLTGNTIAELSQNNLRFVGTCFFACGLIFAFIYLRSRSKVKSKIKGRKRK